MIGKFGGHNDLELATARHQVVRAWGAHASNVGGAEDDGRDGSRGRRRRASMKWWCKGGGG